MGLIWLGLAALTVWALVRLGRQSEGPRRGQWRIAATMIATAMLGGGMLALSRGSWWIGGGLVAAGLYLVVSSRVRSVPMRLASMSPSEARSILGVSAEATEQDIQTAWRRVMGRAHPDQGGTQGLAERVNAARDTLLKRG